MRKFLQSYTSLKTLVIGGSGFIGSHIVRKLHTFKGNVNVVDHNTVDICRPQDVNKIIQKRYDVIFHCAGYSNHLDKYYQSNENQNNYIVSTSNILSALKKYSPKTVLVLLGSRLEYGRPQYLPVDENHPTNPTSLYGIDKLAATTLAQHYYQTYKIPSIVYRISNVYGPHAPFTFQNYNVINYFIDRTKHEKPLTIFGKGEQLRDYVYIDDLVHALLLGPLTKTAYGNIFNIGHGTPITFKDMVSLIAQKRNVKIGYTQWPPDYKSIETGDYYTNISKASKILGWEPTVSYAKGVDLCFS